MKKGFTLIELLVVIGMLMLLMGAVTSSVMSAQRRARMAKATQTCQELTNAILALENYGIISELETGSQWKPADENAIAPLLGGRTSSTGTKIPVLFNADIKGNALLDPWNSPYHFRVAQRTINIKDTAASTVNTCVNFPNYNRRRAGE